MNTPVVVMAMSIILYETAGSLQWRQLWEIEQNTIKIAANLAIILYWVWTGGLLQTADYNTMILNRKALSSNDKQVAT